MQHCVKRTFRKQLSPIMSGFLGYTLLVIANVGYKVVTVRPKPDLPNCLLQAYTSLNEASDQVCIIGFQYIPSMIYHLRDWLYPGYTQDMYSIYRWHRTYITKCTFLFVLAIAVISAGFGQGTGPIFLDGVMCTGNESSLLSCTYSIGYCANFEGVGVLCPPRR